MFKNAQVRSVSAAQDIPDVLQSWLYASGSLTAQLTQLSEGQFKVTPVKERFERQKREYNQWLNMPLHHTAWVREALLYGSESFPWVKATSIFPITSIQKRARIFKTLGNRPIGWFLFQRTSPVCERRILKLDEGWARQSHYRWHGCSFMVQEIFLVSFEEYLYRKQKKGL
ncbi:chorismate lyase [Acinetobacter sp. B5B]|uniref:chorismate--pyruvate lyase family protein n=1 Tax=Acinetobacter baretiae TaxID=2605383 RepID=UPI0018C27782|nr:chorismate lyase [Acinetobacter baretiae]MBF7682938.1 chorismate lyase [Acinetobacter baretiae]MBF7684905.1 chorismate lyase [Acinetobacter baretiae]